MRKIEPEFITGMGYIGASPGVLYHMGGAGEQTVVTGNPAMLEGVKGSRFTSLTLHGKSTQVSTTGANILKDNYLSLCKGRIDLFSANGLFTVNANYEKACEFNLYFSAGSIFPDGIKDEETYYFVFRPIGFTPKYSYQLSLKNEKSESFVTSFNGNVTSVSGADLKKNVRIQLYFFSVSVSEPVVSGSRFQMIFSKKPDCIYEPYTGGNPSPSPSYPQEIENAGMDGEIGVTVTGTNLLPFEVGQKGNGFEVFADGVQVDVDRETDIYAVGQNNSNVESGYDEFALMTAGKYYIYSGTQDVYLYVVVWRKGKNVVLGYSVGTNAAQIEIMDGEKFRIFLRTEAAFKGKVKAMITRTPMNATSYEPYKPVQKLIVPTPNGLPGIPVSSGGNYTDEKGQQWVCDEVDFKKGVYVQRIGKRTITSKDVFHKSGMSTDDVNYFSLGNFSLHIGTIGEKDVLMSNCFVAGINHGFGAWGKIFLSSAFDDKLYFSVEAQKYPDEETFKQWAVENGLMFLYQLVDIIETPLAAEELSAYKTLCTYSPTTTVINDADAWMSVGYKRRK